MRDSLLGRWGIGVVILLGLVVTAGCGTTAPAASAVAPDDAGPAVVAPTANGAIVQVDNSNPGSAPGSSLVSRPAAPQHISWASFQGAPSFHAGSGEGIWVWNEKVGGQNFLHIATTTEGHRHVFSGIVRTGPEGNFWDLDRSHFESDDHASQPAYNEIDFSFVTYGSVDALSVKWSGRGLALDLRNDGQFRPGHVYYGAAGTAAKGLPLVVDAGDEGLTTLPLSTLAGASGFHAGAGDGYWIYSDGSGIHLRTTTKNASDHKYYTGQIRGELTNVALASPDDDWLRWPN
jgi:hypothetical protein